MSLPLLQTICQVAKTDPTIIRWNNLVLQARKEGATHLKGLKCFSLRYHCQLNVSIALDRYIDTYGGLKSEFYDNPELSKLHAKMINNLCASLGVK